MVVSHNMAYATYLMKKEQSYPEMDSFFAWGNMRVRPETPDESRWAMSPACFPAQSGMVDFISFS